MFTLGSKVRQNFFLRRKCLLKKIVLVFRQPKNWLSTQVDSSMTYHLRQKKNNLLNKSTTRNFERQGRPNQSLTQAKVPQERKFFHICERKSFSLTKVLFLGWGDFPLYHIPLSRQFYTGLKAYREIKTYSMCGEIHVENLIRPKNFVKRGNIFNLISKNVRLSSPK